MQSFDAILPTTLECQAALLGDNLIPQTDSTIQLDRAMTFWATPEELAGWILQIGRRDKGRAGYYVPRQWEMFLPPWKRSLPFVVPRLRLREGQSIEDWASFGRNVRAKAEIVRETTLVFTGKRGKPKHPTYWSWELTWTRLNDKECRLHMRMRISALRHPELLPVWDFADRLLCVGFWRGLSERLQATRS